MTDTFTSPAATMAARYGVACILEPETREHLVTVQDKVAVARIVTDWMTDTFTASVGGDIITRPTVGASHTDAANSLWLAVVHLEQRGEFVRSNHYGDFAAATVEEIASLVSLIERIITEVFPHAVAVSEERLAHLRETLGTKESA